MKIYLVMASIDYEGQWPASAFRSKAKAEKLVKSAYAHQSQKPEHPETDSPEDYQKYEDAEAIWLSKLPIEGTSYADDFTIQEIELL
jgi:hypothetical protein